MGRFINADAFAATGIGFVGNNMFAYCNNNPVVNYDSTGAVPISFYDGRDVNPLYIGHLGMGGGGGGGSSEFSGGPSANRKSSRQQAKEIAQRELDYLTNTDPVVAAKAENIAFYYGVPVIKASVVDTGFSFGIIVMGRGNKNPTTVQHEYGHFVHLAMVGIGSYLVTGFLPSFVCYWIGVPYEQYFSLPWDYIADYLGRVNRTYNDLPYEYEDWADDLGRSYWGFSRALGGFF